MSKREMISHKALAFISIIFASSVFAKEQELQALHSNQNADAAYAEGIKQLETSSGKEAFSAYLLEITPLSPQIICAIASTEEDRIAATQYLRLGQKIIPHDRVEKYSNKRATFDSNAEFRWTYRNSTEASADAALNSCNVVVSTVSNLHDLYTMTTRPSGGSSLKLANIGTGIVIDRIALLNDMAHQKGYNDYRDYLFWELGGLQGWRSRLTAQGVVDSQTLRTAYSDMKNDRYNDGNDPYMLTQYLADRADAKVNNVSVLEQRNNRLKNEARAEKQRLTEEKRAEEHRVAEEKKRLAEERKRLAEYAKDYPYRAVFSCRLPSGNNYILPCFNGYSRAIGSSEIRLTTGGASKIIGPLDMVGSSQDLRDGFEIDLPKHFSLSAQNVAEYQKLGLTIYERTSGKAIYSNEVSQFGVIRIAK